MKAFHNDPKVKKKYLARVQAHKLADEIVKGRYWEDGKGCAVGCTIHSSNHNAYENELGIPGWLARVEDTLFEGMLKKRAKTWPEEFLKAIPVGVDLEQVKVPFIVFVLQSSLKSMRAAKFDRKANPQVVAVQDQVEVVVIEMIRCHEQGRDPNAARSAARSAAESAARSAESAARSAESAAWSAAESAESAAWSAVESAARSAASAARSAESAAWSAAWSAAESAARSAARSAEYEKFADELLRLFKSLKPKRAQKREKEWDT